MNEKELPIRMKAGYRLLSITPLELRRHLLSALANLRINGYPPIFRCTVQDGKIVFILDPDAEIRNDLAYWQCRNLFKPGVTDAIEIEQDAKLGKEAAR